MVQKSLLQSSLLLALAIGGMSSAMAQQASPSEAPASSNPQPDWSGGVPDSAYQWYVAPSVGGVISDSKRKTKDSGWVGISIGRWLGPNNTLELGTSVNNARFKNSSSRGGKEWETTNTDLSVRHYWGEQGDKTRFYGLAGLGVVHHSAISNRSGWGPSASLGLGLQHYFNDRIAIRGEAAYRYDRDNDSSLSLDGFNRFNHYGDTVVSLGLVLGLGRAPSAVSRQPPIQPIEPAMSCSQLDDDQDGVSNCDDLCPGTNMGTLVGPDGCVQKVVIDLRGVNFKFDHPKVGEHNIESTLQEPTTESKAILDQALDTLSRYPSLQVQVVGYTDSIGSEDYNQGLSERRAVLVNQYLLDHGITPDRLNSPLGQGESNPIGPNSTSSGRAQNRRVEFDVKQESPLEP